MTDNTTDYRCIRCENCGVPRLYMNEREAQAHSFDHMFIKRDTWQDFDQADNEADDE